MSPHPLMLSEDPLSPSNGYVTSYPPDADEDALERSARGFILTLMGSFLFTDKKGVHVHLCFLPLLRDLTHTATYSWGGAVLAHTYRKLCRASLDRRRGISGCITLIQVCKNYFLLHTNS